MEHDHLIAMLNLLKLTAIRSLTKRDRSRFLGALDTALQAAMRESLVFRLRAGCQRSEKVFPNWL
jgi:hypothetical protein